MVPRISQTYLIPTSIARTFPLGSFLLILMAITPVPGFIPDALAGISSPTSVFHTVMTKKALKIHAMEFLDEFRPGGSSTTGSLRRELGDNPSAKELFLEMYGINSDPEPFEDVLDQLASAVASVDHDKDTKSDPKWHFDAEKLEDGRHGLLNEIELILKLIRENQFEIGREKLGKMIHPLQDFYSHSNWIEMGQKEPLHELVNRDYILPLPVADKNFKSCSNCERGWDEKIKSALLTFSVVAPIGFGALGGSEQNIYKCKNNIEAHRNLTSGFYTNQYDEDGNKIEKRPGKCSHGGALDITSGLFATGGINKDMKNSLFSPHYYLHEFAAVMARNATVDLLNLLRRRVNNDLKWSQFLQLSPGPTLAFVVDICPSMSQYIPVINKTILRSAKKNSANHALTGLKQTFIIVGFNDKKALEPEIGESQEDLNKIIDRTFAFYEEECKGDTRMIYGAIQKAALKSGVGGYLFVTTDGFPGDYYLEPWVTSTVRNKQLRFKMVLANQMSTIYLARSAAIARVAENGDGGSEGPRDEFHGLRKMARDNGGSVRFVAQASDAVVNFETGTKNQDQPAHVIIAQDNKNRAFRIPVDPTVKQLEISVTATAGPPPQITVKDSSGTRKGLSDKENIAGINYNVILTPVTPEDAGVWTVRATHILSEMTDIRPKTEYFISVRAKTELKFKTKFLHDADLTNLHPGTQSIGRQNPLAGTMLVLEIIPQSRTLPTNLSLNFVEFRTTQWDLLSRFRIDRSILMGKSFYAAVVIPYQSFHVRLSGTINGTYSFIRTDPNQIDPSTLQLETSRPRLNSTTKLMSSKTARFDFITKSIQQPLAFKVKFSITNHGMTNGLFTVKIDDTAEAVVDYQPRTVVIGSNRTVTGHAFLEIPGNKDLVVTEMTLQVSGARTLTSNTLISYVTISR